MSSEKRKHKLTAKGANYKKEGTFKFRGQQKKQPQSQQCRCCGKIMFNVTPTEFMNQHHLLESHNICFKKGLYHCELPTCSHYTYRKCDLDKHYKTSLPCNLYLQNLESEKIEAQLTTTSVPIKNIHAQSETLFIGQELTQNSNSVDLFKTNYFLSLQGKSDHELRTMIEEAKKRENLLLEHSKMQQKVSLQNESVVISNGNDPYDMEYQDDAFVLPEIIVPDSNDQQHGTISSSVLLDMKREIEIHKKGTTIGLGLHLLLQISMISSLVKKARNQSRRKRKSRRQL